MKKARTLYIPVLLLVMVSCNQIFPEHYNQAPETIDKSIWESIKGNADYSTFVALFEELELDSIFAEEGSYTLFVPNNEAFSNFHRDSFDLEVLLRYHVLNFMFNMAEVKDSRPVQTFSGKFAMVENYQGVHYFDVAEILDASPLHRDGQYYELDAIGSPRATLYEFVRLTSSVMQDYVDSYDSVILDLDLSIPIGFDDDGNTVYDSVYTIANFFDTIYYPLKEEHRSRTATFVLFNDDQYVYALDEMAGNLSGFTSGDDIPQSWQQNILMPHTVETGLFPNSLHYEDFLPGYLRNIQGDTVEVDYTAIDPDSREICSNGVIFKYQDFTIPTHLYKGEVWIEGEHMIDSVAAGFNVWNDLVTVSGSPEALAAIPKRSLVNGARNDSLLTLAFQQQGFDGEFDLEFTFKEMFPQEYLLRWAGIYRPSGEYEIWVNGEKVENQAYALQRKDTWDSYYFLSLEGFLWSMIDGQYYIPSFEGYNILDALVTNITDFGDITVQLKYVGSGAASDNGISIDYISLTPTDVVEFENK